MASETSAGEGTKPVRIYLCTWNVGFSEPPDDLTDLLDLTNQQLPDIYVIGLQEMSADELFSDNNAWTVKLTDVLSAQGYFRFKMVRLVGILEVAFVRRRLMFQITSIESEWTKTGLYGLWGNKGGVCIRFEINDTDICIQNSHLTAHRDKVAERIQDYSNILDNQKFKDDNVDNILDHDYVFWMGDLNFRLDDVDRGKVLREIKNENFKYLLMCDQLKTVQSEELAFVNFCEGEITFPPTYKFDVGTDDYDTSEKQRIPAWCDRILWLVNNDTSEALTAVVKQLSYRSHKKYKGSDHRPVTSVFDIQVFDKPSQAPPVTFLPLSRWYSNKAAVIKYTVKPEFATSSWDWIGLYKINFRHVFDYVWYVWALSNTETSQQQLKEVIIPSSTLSELSSGKYCLCYVAHYKSMLKGKSEEFEIVS